MWNFFKNNIKRSLTLLILLSLALSMASCGDPDNGSEQTEELYSDDETLENTSDIETDEEKTDEEDTEGETEGKTEFVSPEISEGTDILHGGFGENKKYVVVIDAGHQSEGMSGKEPNGPNSDVMKTQLAWGTQGTFTGIPEYELTLGVSLALRDELLRRGYTVVMVRETSDVKISNMERALLANRYMPSEENGYAGAVNIRVHANGLDDSSVRGVLTVCSSQNNEFAIGSLYSECYELSEKIVNAYSQSTGIPKRTNSVRYDDSMTGTNWCEIPTTIIELGFMTNKEDDELMATDAFRSNAAKGIADGIESYFNSHR